MTIGGGFKDFFIFLHPIFVENDPFRQNHTKTWTNTCWFNEKGDSINFIQIPFLHLPPIIREVKKKGPSNGSCSSKKAPFFSSMFFGKEYPSTGNCLKKRSKSSFSKQHFSADEFWNGFPVWWDDMCFLVPVLRVKKPKPLEIRFDFSIFRGLLSLWSN